MASTVKDVQGAALYLEFRKVGATCQIVVTPDSIGTKGEVVWSKFFRRVVRPEAPKKRWSAYTLAPTTARRADLTSHMMSGSVDHIEHEVIVEERLRHVVDYLDSLLRNGYSLVKGTPLYVEVTKADVDEVGQGSLSAKVWNRVKASRTAAGFPTTLTD